LEIGTQNQDLQNQSVKQEHQNKTLTQCKGQESSGSISSQFLFLFFFFFHLFIGQLLNPKQYLPDFWDNAKPLHNTHTHTL